MPFLSVVIPTCNRPSLLRACLQRLEIARNALEANSCEIIVSDDGQGQETEAMLRTEFPSVRWIAGPRRGPAANRNCGARHALGKWLVFIDDDCQPTSGILRSYFDAIKTQPDCVVFEGRIIADREKCHPLEESPINEKGGNLWSCNFAISAETLAQIGGFEERFLHATGEDSDFCYRIRKVGHRITFVPDALVIHPWRRRDWYGHLRHRRRSIAADMLRMRLHPELVNYFTVWNVVKDVARYYVRQFQKDVRRFGPVAILYQPLFWTVQILRMIAYAQRRMVSCI